MAIDDVELSPLAPVVGMFPPLGALVGGAGDTVVVGVVVVVPGASTSTCRVHADRFGDRRARGGLGRHEVSTCEVCGRGSAQARRLVGNRLTGQLGDHVDRAGCARRGELRRRLERERVARGGHRLCAEAEHDRLARPAVQHGGREGATGGDTARLDHQHRELARRVLRVHLARVAEHQDTGNASEQPTLHSNTPSHVRGSEADGSDATSRRPRVGLRSAGCADQRFASGRC